MKRDIRLYLQDILDSCIYIQEFVENMGFEEFDNDEKTSSAVIRKFEIIGEAVKNIPESIKSKYAEVPWSEMAAMRNRLIHAYFGVDYRLIWDTIESDIPEAIKIISETIENFEDEH